MSLRIRVTSGIDIEFYISDDGSIYVDVEAEGMSENILGDKEISKETLESYINKLQEIYNSVNKDSNK